MELTANREVLLPALTRAVGVVERRHTLPILGNLLLEADHDRLRLVGTDVEVEIRSECGAQVAQPGEVTVPARKLTDICKSLPEGADLAFRVTNERCTVMSGRSRFVLGVLPAADFPRADEELGGVRLEVAERFLKRLLDKTAFAMAQQDVRYYLNGLLFELEASGVIAVATDGHRLAKLQSEAVLDIGDPIQVILPSKTVLELKRQLEPSDAPVVLTVADKSIRVEVGGTRVTSKLIDGRYPDYERAIPKALNKEASADKESLRHALSRTAILSNEKYRGLRLSFSEGVLRLQAHNPEQEQAEEEIELEYAGEETAIGFNVGYLMDVLGAIEERRVSVQFQDGDSSSIWRGVGASGETYVVMPMRL